MADAAMNKWLRDIGVAVPGDPGDDATASSVMTASDDPSAPTTLSDPSDYSTTTSPADPSAVTAPSDPPPAPAQDDLTVPRPCPPGCKPLRNQVAGPKSHVLCQTHGHVYDEDTHMVIANSVAEYDAAHPIPRPMQPDCEADHGKLPYAPKNIVMCKHGHVLDTDKGLIVGNTRTMYLRAHPEHGGANSAADIVGHASLNASPFKSNIDDVTLTVDLHGTGDWQFKLSWTYAKEPEGDTPDSIQEVVLLHAPDDADSDAVYCFPHAIKPGQTYTYSGKGHIKSVPEGTWNAEVQIMPKGWPDKIMDKEWQDFEVKKKP